MAKGGRRCQHLHKANRRRQAVGDACLFSLRALCGNSIPSRREFSTCDVLVPHAPYLALQRVTTLPAGNPSGGWPPTQEPGKTVQKCLLLHAAAWVGYVFVAWVFWRASHVAYSLLGCMVVCLWFAGTNRCGWEYLACSSGPGSHQQRSASQNNVLWQAIRNG